MDSSFGNICWRKDHLPTLVFLGFPSGSDGKESDLNAGDLDLIPGSGRSPEEEGIGYPLQGSSQNVLQADKCWELKRQKGQLLG